MQIDVKNSITTTAGYLYFDGVGIVVRSSYTITSAGYLTLDYNGGDLTLLQTALVATGDITVVAATCGVTYVETPSTWTTSGSISMACDASVNGTGNKYSCSRFNHSSWLNL